MKKLEGVCLGLSAVLILSATPVGSGVRTTQSAAALENPQTMEKELNVVLDEQADAWNRGDIESFMKGYWKSPKTVFAGSGGVQRGWDAVLARYKRNYPDRAAMGRLTFSDLEITPLGADAAVILGRWQLQREKDAPGGVFTLVARRFREGWRIIHDHTSAFAAPAKQ